MKTALLFNHKAGKGLPAEQVVRRLCDFFYGDTLLVPSESARQEVSVPLEQLTLTRSRR